MPPIFSRKNCSHSLLLSLTVAVFGNIMPVFADNPEVTVYNQNFALVKDYRDLSLKNGVNTVFFDDVAAKIDPTSVHFKSLTAPQGVTVLEQNFRYDLISKSNILDRMVGKTIRFRKDGVEKEGILLNPVTNYVRNSYYNGASYESNYSQNTTSEFAVKTKEGVLLTTLGDVIVDSLPEGLYPRPTLMWKLGASSGGTHHTQVSYLTDGLTWRCDYVAVISPNDDSLDLTGWVSVDNQTGAKYENAKLKLVAGDVRKLNPARNFRAAREMMAKSAINEVDAAAPQFSQEDLFEYHLYTLKDRTTVANNETKQVSLVSANQIPITKRYIYDPDRISYHNWLSSGWSDGYYGTYNYYGRPGDAWSAAAYKKVNTLIVLKNSEQNHLGMPLPKGKIRVNKADSSGSLQFIGEDAIDHTPKDEKIELYLGDAFDLVGEKKRSRYRQESSFIEETYEVSLRNHKKSPVTIESTDHLFGDWTMVSNSHPFKKSDSHTVVFPVVIPADGETRITYTVRIKRN